MSDDKQQMRLALAFLLAMWVSPAPLAETLSTPSFTVHIDVKCAEGNVTCNDVTYMGTSKKSGKFIILHGKTMHSLCADGVTPCGFQGYEFQRGATRYEVLAGGRLTVMRGANVLLHEQGEWVP